MSETKQYLKFINQLISMQIEDYENGLPIDKATIQNSLNKLKQLIMEEK